jgi:hypothetical protein
VSLINKRLHTELVAQFIKIDVTGVNDTFMQRDMIMPFASPTAKTSVSQFKVTGTGCTAGCQWCALAKASKAGNDFKG